MTETIGWGDVDVDPERIRRRRRRWAVIVVPVVVIVVAAVVMTPIVRDQLAKDAARWLQREWVTAQAYDAAREAVEEQASEHAGFNDRRNISHVAAVADDEEAQRLQRIDGAVARHRTWAGDVTSARAAVHRALAAQVRDLRADAPTTYQHLGTSTYPPSPDGSETSTLIAHADAAVSHLLTTHHLRPAALPQVTLPASRRALTPLLHVTDRPLPLHVVFKSTDSYDDWDLASGHSHEVGLPPGDESDDGMPAQIVDGYMLLGTAGQWRIVSLHSGGVEKLPSADNYLPGGSGGWWRQKANTIQHFTPSGRADGPVNTLSTGYSAIGATQASVVLFAAPPYTSLPTVLLNLGTGRTYQLPQFCSNSNIVSAVAAYPTCDQERLVVVDDNGRTTSVAAPRGYVFVGIGAISPDGTKVAWAVEKNAGGGDVLDGDLPTKLVVVDVPTRHTTTIDDGAAQVVPVGWSSDGSTLILQDARLAFDCCGSQAAGAFAIAYWQQGMADFGTIRIAPPTVDFTIGTY